MHLIRSPICVTTLRESSVPVRVGQDRDRLLSFAAATCRGSRSMPGG